MPITGPSSYVPTIDEFLAHWLAVNNALGAAGPMVLPHGGTIVILTGFRGQLDGYRASVKNKQNVEEIARGALEIQRTELMKRLGQFNRKVRGSLSHTAFAAALPQVPSITAAPAVLIEELDDMESLWVKINAATIPGFTGPLLLLDGYALATFTTALTAFRAAVKAWSDAVEDLQLEREQRNDVQDLAHAILSEYRPAVEGNFDPTHALVATIPKIAPEPGSTPDPVTANGQWIDSLGMAKITFPESLDANLLRYELRMCAGANYTTDNEVVVGSILPGAPREFVTADGLPSPGSVATYKVYVITTTLNERGSNTVSVTRP